MQNGRFVLNRDFQNYFPEWKNTFIEDAESYIGITIKDNNDTVIGLLAVADDKPIGNSNLAESIMSLAASRTSAELLRYMAQQDSDRRRGVDCRLACTDARAESAGPTSTGDASVQP